MIGLDVIKRVLEIREEFRRDMWYGPYRLLVSRAMWNELDRDYSPYPMASMPCTILDRILRIEGITEVKVADQDQAMILEVV